MKSLKTLSYLSFIGFITVFANEYSTQYLLRILGSYDNSTFFSFASKDYLPVVISFIISGFSFYFIQSKAFTFANKRPITRN